MSTLTRALPTKPGGHERARLSLNPDRGKGDSDGTWWPGTTNLQTELPALDVAVHQLTGSRIARIAYTYGQWEPAPRKQWTPLGMIKLGWFTHSTHPENIDLSLADYTRLVLTVIAPTSDPVMANITHREHGTPPTGFPPPANGPVGPLRGRRRWPTTEHPSIVNRWPTREHPSIVNPIVGLEPLPPWTTR